MSKFVVMRHATLMEDEGRDQVICVTDSRDAAEKAIDHEVETAKGYFHRGEYFIVETEGVT